MLHEDNLCPAVMLQLLWSRYSLVDEVKKLLLEMRPSFKSRTWKRPLQIPMEMPSGLTVDDLQTTIKRRKILKNACCRHPWRRHQVWPLMMKIINGQAWWRLHGRLQLAFPKKFLLLTVVWGNKQGRGEGEVWNDTFVLYFLTFWWAMIESFWFN